MGIILDQIKKRRCYPVPALGADVFVTALSNGDVDIAKTLTDEQSAYFMVGTAICNNEGKQEFPRLTDESITDYVKRVRELTLDCGLDFIAITSQALQKIGKIPPPDVIVKNS